MNIRKKMLVTGMLVCGLVFAGCSPMNRKETKSDSWQEYVEKLKNIPPDQVNSHITEQVSDSLVIDADVEGLDGLKQYKLGNLKMTRHIFSDKKKLLDQLMNRMPISNPTEPKERQTEYYLENGNEEKSLEVTSENTADCLQVRDSYMIGSLLGDSEYSYLGLDVNQENMIENPKIDMLNQDQDLQFMTVKEVRAETQNFLKETGITAEVNMKVYSAAEEKLQEIAQKVNKEREELPDAEPISVSDEYEGYVIGIYQVYKGVPVICYGVPNTVSNSSYGVEQKCSMFWTKDGIKDLTLRNVYDMGEEEKPQKILSVGNVLEKIEQQNQRTARKNQKERVVKIQLFYVPVHEDGENLNFTAKPVWYVISHVDGDEFTKISVTVYDAVTGEVMPWKE